MKIRNHGKEKSTLANKRELQWILYGLYVYLWHVVKLVVKMVLTDSLNVWKHKRFTAVQVSSNF